MCRLIFKYFQNDGNNSADDNGIAVTFKTDAVFTIMGDNPNLGLAAGNFPFVFFLLIAETGKLAAKFYKIFIAVFQPSKNEKSSIKLSILIAVSFAKSFPTSF